MWTAIISLLGALCGPLLKWWQGRQDANKAEQRLSNQVAEESHSEVITDAGQKAVDQARIVSDDRVSSLDDSGLQQQSDTIAAAIAAANSELR